VIASVVVSVIAGAGQQSVGELDNASKVGGDVPDDRPRCRETRVIRRDDDLADRLRQMTSTGARGVHLTGSLVF